MPKRDFTESAQQPQAEMSSSTGKQRAVGPPSNGTVDGSAQRSEALLLSLASAPPPRKQARTGGMTSVGGVRRNNNEREDESARRSDDDERQDNGVVVAAAASASVTPPAVVAQQAPSKGIILRSGRIRLPDKLIQVRGFVILFYCTAFVYFYLIF